MSRKVTWLKAFVFVALAAFGSAIQISAHTQTDKLATVNIPKPVLANGQLMAAGTYTVRLAAAAAPVAGKPDDGSRWVEFVQGDKVIGRELTSVVAAGDAQSVLKGPGPAPGAAKVEMLKGNEYLRIWINHSGTHYLIHLPVK